MAEPLPIGEAPPRAAPRSTYDQILKSSILIGGASVIGLAIGMVRAKAVAMLLGPAGVGLMGLYSAIVDLARSLAACGVADSGVRQIAQSAQSGDHRHIAATATVVRRLALVLGLIGAGLVVLLSVPIATLTFGDGEHAGSVALLSLAVLFGVVAGGQTALVQGLRRIAALAHISVFGAGLGVLVSLPVIYLMGERGIAPAIVVAAAATAATSWWHSRKLQVAATSMAAAEARLQVASLLKLGFAFMSSGLMVLGAAYVVRLILTRHAGIEAAGLYQASWTLGGLYVGFVLQAMGTDFYPRLAGVAHDDVECNRLVNEQAQVSLLLAGPGVMATLTLAPAAIAIFYSTQFHGAVEILRWICLGMTLRVISWPMGFIIVAKGRQTIFVACEMAWTAVSLGLAWLLVSSHGLVGAGMAFFGSYIFHALLVYPVVRGLSGFRWSAENLRTGFGFLIAIGIVFGGFLLLPAAWAFGLGAIATLGSSLLSLRVLGRLMSADGLPAPLRRVLALVPRMPAWAR